MNVVHLVTMVNEIAAFFDADPDKDAASVQVAQHLRRYWEPRMRAAIRAHLAHGGEGLSELGRRAVARAELAA